MTNDRSYYREVYKGDTVTISHIFSFVPDSFEWSVSIESCVIGNATQNGRIVDAQVTTQAPYEALVVLRATSPDGGTESISWRIVPIGGDNRTVFSGIQQENLQDYLATENGEILCEDGSTE
jgi:hypothetical protein